MGGNSGRKVKPPHSTVAPPSPPSVRLSESLDQHPNTTIAGSNQPTASCLSMLDRLEKASKMPGREFAQERIRTG